MMFLVGTLIFSMLFALGENRIYLYDTEDGLGLESYDCIVVENLPLCRRPREPIDLRRDEENSSCTQNGGVLRRFQFLRSLGINVSRVLHQWKVGLEQAERYSRYLRQSTTNTDEFLCQCLDKSAFGKNCEYLLPEGTTFIETWNWQLYIRTKFSRDENIYGEFLCYETLSCNSGLLCLDWREICDGTQNCMDAADEKNCDLLEMNICQEDEYRCMNGMCIPEPFFSRWGVRLFG